MKGLFIKDFMLLKMQKTFFLVIVLITLMMAFSMSDVFFVLSYLCFFMPLLALSTMSYDELDNGNVFLFTWPISRKEYVLEKYCLGLILGLGTLLASIPLSFIYTRVKGGPDFQTIMMSLPIFFLLITLFLSLLIPIQIKFGAEKGKYVKMMAIGILMVVFYALYELSGYLGFDIRKAFESLSPISVILLSFLVTLGILLISMRISLSILKKKEF